MSQGEPSHTTAPTHQPATSQLVAATGGTDNIMMDSNVARRNSGLRHSGDPKKDCVKRFESAGDSDDNPAGRHEVRLSSACGEREEPFSTDDWRFSACDKENGEPSSTRRIRRSACDKEPFSEQENRVSTCPDNKEPFFRDVNRFSACCDKDNKESFSRNELRFLSSDKENEENLFSSGGDSFPACFEDDAEPFSSHKKRCLEGDEEPFSRRGVRFVAWDGDNNKPFSRHNNHFSACDRDNEEPFSRHETCFAASDDDKKISFLTHEDRFSVSDEKKEGSSSTHENRVSACDTANEQAFSTHGNVFSSTCNGDNKEQFNHSEMVLSDREGVIEPDDCVIRSDNGVIEPDDGIIRPGMPESDQDVTMMGGNLWEDDILPPPSNLPWRESICQVTENDGVVEPDCGVIELDDNAIETDRHGVIETDNLGVIDTDDDAVGSDDGVIRPGMPEADQDVTMLQASLWQNDILPPTGGSSCRKSSQALSQSRQIETPALTSQMECLQTEMSITATACLQSLLRYTKACVDRGEPLAEVRARATKTFRDRPPLCPVGATAVMETVDAFERISAMHLMDMVESFGNPDRRSDLTNQGLLEAIFDAL